jgi:cell shape-determining protein MreC
LIRKKGNPERRIKEAEEEKDKQYSLLSHTALFQFQMDVLYDTLRKREAELEELRPFQEENIKLKKELKKWTDPEKIEFT